MNKKNLDKVPDNKQRIKTNRRSLTNAAAGTGPAAKMRNLHWPGSVFCSPESIKVRGEFS